MEGRTRCGCESSRCDHDGRCPREVDPRIRMAYVGDTCTQCAANMAATGGGEYLTLREPEAEFVGNTDFLGRDLGRVSKEARRRVHEDDHVGPGVEADGYEAV